MKLRPENLHIKISGEEVVHLLHHLNTILISLRNIGSYYSAAAADAAGNEFPTQEYEHETTAFIDNWKVTQRLAEARAILTRHFDRTLGEDDMDDLERAMETTVYWSRPGSPPPPSSD